MMVYVWLGILVAAVVLELATAQIVSIWFAIGALAAFIAALVGVEQLWIQIVIFVMISAIAVAVTRPLVKKMINKKAEPTNADMVIGKTGIVTEKIDNLAPSGLVKVNGTVWTARTADDSVIEENEKVIIKEISGVKLLVTSPSLPESAEPVGKEFSSRAPTSWKAWHKSAPWSLTRLAPLPRAASGWWQSVRIPTLPFTSQKRSFWSWPPW